MAGRGRVGVKGRGILLGFSSLMPEMMNYNTTQLDISTNLCCRGGGASSQLLQGQASLLS